MGRFDAYPVLPETATGGFVCGLITPLDADRAAGACFVQGPDGSRAGLQWELSDSPFLMRIEAPGADDWGVYRAGFTRRPATVADLVVAVEQVMPKLKILYARCRTVPGSDSTI